MDWVVLDADKTAGGVMIMWDKRVLEKLEVLVGLFSVLIQWKGVVDGFIWACSGVYGPNDNSLRGDLWDELVFISTGMFLGVVLGILTLSASLVNGGVGLVLLRLWKSFLNLLMI